MEWLRERWSRQVLSWYCEIPSQKEVMFTLWYSSRLWYKMLWPRIISPLMHSFQQTNYINTTFITLLCKKIAKQWQMQKVRTGNDRKSEWMVNSWKASLLVHGYWSLWNSAASSLIYLPHMHCVSHQHLFNREIFLRFIFTACVMAWSRRRGFFAHWGPLLPFSHWTVLTDWSWNCQGFIYIIYISFSWRGKHPLTRRPLNAMREKVCAGTVCPFANFPN